MGDQDKESILRALLKEGEGAEAKALADSQRLTAMLRESADNRRITLGLLDHVGLPSAYVEKLSVQWRQANDATRALGHEVREMYGVYAPTFNTVALATSTASTGVAVTCFGAASGQGTASTPAARRTLEEAGALMSRQGTAAQVREGLVRCGLNVPRADRRSPLDLLDESQTSLEQAAQGVGSTSSLVPLRQCMERTVVHLFERCSTGGIAAGSWNDKVIVIGNVAQKPNLQEGYFPDLAKTLAPQIERLSERGKDRVMERAEVLILYADGLNFLRSLLEGVDERRLRLPL